MKVHPEQSWLSIGLQGFPGMESLQYGRSLKSENWQSLLRRVRLLRASAGLMMSQG